MAAAIRFTIRRGSIQIEDQPWAEPVGSGCSWSGLAEGCSASRPGADAWTLASDDQTRMRWAIRPARCSRWPVRNERTVVGLIGTAADADP